MPGDHLLTLTRAWARELDRRARDEYGLPTLVLMENAGRGVVDVLGRLAAPGPVVVCCGLGNNGGDGFVIARHLDLRGLPVRVLLTGSADRLAGDAATNYRVAARAGIAIEAVPPETPLAAWLERLAGAGTLVDAILGTGTRGDPRPPAATAIEALNRVPACRVAVDLPSGLDADTGWPGNPTVRADHTCTFVAPKRGFLTPGAAEYTGQVHVLDIGAPRRLVEDVLARAARD